MPNNYPSLTIKERKSNNVVYTSMLEQGVPEWTADLISKRIDGVVDSDSIFSPSLSNIEDPSFIPNMDIATERIVSAIINNERIILAVDHDLDGTASAAVLWKTFVGYFNVNPNNIEIVTSHRLNEGYGITEQVAKRIINSGATLVISADKGSSDEPRIKKISDAGIDVIVTDHHTVPIEGPPISAFAVVNPTIASSSYDPNVCGAAVAFLTMAKVRTELIKREVFESIPSLSSLLDYVAIATIGDCVALRPDKSYTNRAFVKFGLSLLNKTNRPCWKVFKTNIEGPVLSETIAFQLAPPISSAGRLDWAEAGFRFLIADSYEQASEQWSILQVENDQRKKIEKELRDRAFKIASKMDGASITLYFDDGHSGVHGITASRLVEKFGKPSGIFAPKGAGARNKETDYEVSTELASGSFRSIDGVHIRNALQFIDDKYPGLLVGFGGHSGAAGATIAINDIDKFSVMFEEAILAQIGNLKLAPEIFIDGVLSSKNISLETVDKLRNIEPWGKDFPYPIYKGIFTVKHLRVIGKTEEHLKLILLTEERKEIDAIWFYSIDDGKSPVKVNDSVCFIYKLSDNWFRKNRKLQLNIIDMDIS